MKFGSKSLVFQFRCGIRRFCEEWGMRGFVATDPLTETLGEIQGARILVKKRGEFTPSVLEIGVEEDIYFLSLWWEVRPVWRKNQAACVEASRREGDEDRGDGVPCMGLRIEKREG